jgi:hypothetical protein
MDESKIVFWCFSPHSWKEGRKKEKKKHNNTHFIDAG